MTSSRRNLLLTLVAATLLTACSEGEKGQAQVQAAPPIQVVKGPPEPAASAPMPKGSCWALGLKNVVGQLYTGSIAEQARQSSSAQTLQVLESGEPSAGAPDGDRLTLEINDRNTIVDARCG